MIARAWMMGKLCKPGLKTITTKNDKVILCGTLYVNERVWGGKYENGFFDFRVFGKLATMLGDSIQVGDLVHVNGRLAFNEWTSKDEVKHQEMYVVVDKILNLTGMLDGKKNEDVPMFDGNEGGAVDPATIADDDNEPF